MLPDFRARFEEAERLRRDGRLTAALEVYQALLRQRLAEPEDKATGAVRWTRLDLALFDRMAEVAAQLDQVKPADALLQAIVACCEQEDDRYGRDYALLKRAELALESDLLDEAGMALQSMESSIGKLNTIDCSESGVVAWERELRWRTASADDRTFILSRLYLVLGRFFAARGLYHRALALLERGLTHTGPTAPGPTRQTLLPLQLAIGSALLEMGHLAEAEDKLREMSPDLRKMEPLIYYIRQQELLGKLNLLSGELGNAYSHFVRVLDLCQRLGQRPAVLRAALNLAHLLIYLNATRAAESFLRQVRDDAVVLGDPGLGSRAALLWQLAAARRRSPLAAMPAPSVSSMWGVSDVEDLSTQQDEAPENLLDQPLSSSCLRVFEERSLRFYWHVGRHDFDAAAQTLSRLYSMFQQADSSLIQIRLQIMEGILAFYRRDFVRAETALSEIRPHLQGRNLRPELWQVQRILVRCWATLDRPEEEQNSLKNENQVLLKELTESLPPDIQPVFLLNKFTDDEEYIVREVDELTRLKRTLGKWAWLRHPRQHWNMLKRLHSLIEHIDHYQDPRASRTLDGADAPPAPLTGEPLWRRLLTHPFRRVTVSFLVMPDRVLVIRVGWWSLDFGVSPISRAQVRDVVSRWHELINHLSGFAKQTVSTADGAIPRDNASVEAEIKEVANYLAAMLQLDAVLGTLPRYVQALTIIPDDSLHGFPFAAIPYKGKYLVESFVLSIGYSHRTRERAALPATDNEALLVGSSHGNKEFICLPGVPAELDLVKASLSRFKLNVSELRDSTASSANVLACLPRSRVAHIACHGVFEPNQPAQSGLALIPNAGEPEQRLSFIDLSQVNLSGVQHITLSSCWAADHFILPGRWIVSLPQTLQRAGAASVLGCLWKVDDDSAQRLMEHFYSNLDKWPRDEALRQAQLAFLQTPHGRDMCNLDRWAGYNLYGDYGRLKL